MDVFQFFLALGVGGFMVRSLLQPRPPPSPEKVHAEIRAGVRHLYETGDLSAARHHLEAAESAIELWCAASRGSEPRRHLAGPNLYLAEVAVAGGDLSGAREALGRGRIRIEGYRVALLEQLVPLLYLEGVLLFEGKQDQAAREVFSEALELMGKASPPGEVAQVYGQARDELLAFLDDSDVAHLERGESLAREAIGHRASNTYSAREGLWHASGYPLHRAVFRHLLEVRRRDGDSAALAEELIRYIDYLTGIYDYFYAVHARPQIAEARALLEAELGPLHPRCLALLLQQANTGPSDEVAGLREVLGTAEAEHPELDRLRLIEARALHREGEEERAMEVARALEVDVAARQGYIHPLVRESLAFRSENHRERGSASWYEVQHHREGVGHALRVLEAEGLDPGDPETDARVLTRLVEEARSPPPEGPTVGVDALMGFVSGRWGAEPPLQAASAVAFAAAGGCGAVSAPAHREQLQRMMRRLGEASDEHATKRLECRLAWLKTMDSGDEGGRLAEAPALVEEVRRAAEAPRTLRIEALATAAWAFLGGGDAATAVGLFRDAAELASEAPELAEERSRNLVHYARALCEQGSPAEAVVALEEDLGRVRSREGSTWRDALCILEPLCQCYREAGDPGRVREALEALLEEFQGADLERTEVQAGVAGLLRSHGELERAIELVEQATRTRGPLVAEYEQTLVDMYSSLAAFYSNAGRKADSRRIYTLLLTRAEDAYGDHSSEVRMWQRCLEDWQ